MENVQDIFRVSSYSSNSTFSFHVTLAHQQWGIRKRFHHSIARYLMGCIPLCVWECRKVVGEWCFFGSFVLRFSARRHLQWWLLEMVAWLENGSHNNIVQHHVLLIIAIAYPAQRKYLDEVCTWHNGTRRQCGTFSRLWLAVHQPLLGQGLFRLCSALLFTAKCTQ